MLDIQHLNFITFGNNVKFEHYSTTYCNLMAAATVKDKDSYLEWVATWKRYIKELEKYIRALKKLHRVSISPNMTDAVQAGRWRQVHKAADDLVGAKYMARRMYEMRMNMKLASAQQRMNRQTEAA
jgi:hypothetical protein